MAAALPYAPTLSCTLHAEGESHISSDGVVDLKWSADGASQFLLEEISPSSDGDFIQRYKGPDQSSVRSGLAEGMHRFRVRGICPDGIPGPWSDPLNIEVRYMDASRVRLLLILGGIVVLATILAIIHGHFSHHIKEAAS